MLMSICTVFDSVNKVYGRPMFVRTVGEAQRGFSDEASKPDSEISRHSSDYSLYELGVYDDDTASFELLKSPRLVCRAVDLIVT